MNRDAFCFVCKPPNMLIQTSLLIENIYLVSLVSFLNLNIELKWKDNCLCWTLRVIMTLHWSCCKTYSVCDQIWNLHIESPCRSWIIWFLILVVSNGDLLLTRREVWLHFFVGIWHYFNFLSIPIYRCCTK